MQCDILISLWWYKESDWRFRRRERKRWRLQRRRRCNSCSTTRDSGTTTWPTWGLHERWTTTIHCEHFVSSSTTRNWANCWVARVSFSMSHASHLLPLCKKCFYANFSQQRDSRNGTCLFMRYAIRWLPVTLIRLSASRVYTKSYQTDCQNSFDDGFTNNNYNKVIITYSTIP